jgi:tripartite motif-containing protein 71
VRTAITSVALVALLASIFPPPHTLASAGVTTAACSYERTLIWGGKGSSDGQFDHLTSIVADESGAVYTTDMFNHRAQKFTSDGGFVLAWGSYGSGDGQFNQPHGLAIDASGYLYVADKLNHRIQKFNDQGVFVTKWGSQGAGNGQFIEPRGIAASPTGEIYVADTGNHRVQKFTADGTYIAQWGSYGSAQGQFDSPWGIGVDADGFVYVTEEGNHRIQKFTAGGTFITAWGSYGDALGQFHHPADVVVGANQLIYVADAANGRIQVFTPAGDFLLAWSVSSPPGSMIQWGQTLPTGIDLDAAGTVVYVADTWFNHVNKFEPRPSGLDHIAVQDEPGAGGKEIVYHPMAVGDTLDVYAAGRDACHNYLGDLSVDWTTTGSLDPQSGVGSSFTFSPVTSQTMGAIVADDGDDHTGETGLILVDWDWPFDVYLPYFDKD